MVEVLPLLGPEGSYLYKDEINNFPGLNVIGVYAVYRVPETVFSDVNFPAGEYAIVYLSAENLPDVALQVKHAKIVRMDYIFGYPESNELSPKHATKFILQPLKSAKILLSSASGINFRPGVLFYGILKARR